MHQLPWLRQRSRRVWQAVGQSSLKSQLRLRRKLKLNPKPQRMFVVILDQQPPRPGQTIVQARDQTIAQTLVPITAPHLGRTLLRVVPVKTRAALQRAMRRDLPVRRQVVQHLRAVHPQVARLRGVRPQVRRRVVVQRISHAVRPARPVRVGAKSIICVPMKVVIVVAVVAVKLKASRRRMVLKCPPRQWCMKSRSPKPLPWPIWPTRWR